MSNEGSKRLALAWYRRIDWVQLFVSELVLAGLLSGILLVGSEWREDRRAARAERLENLRFVRSLSGKIAVERPFAGLDLSEQNLGGLHLEEASFSRATLRRSSFDEADVRGADFSFADLTEATFADAKIDGAVFRDTLMRDVNFEDARLRGSVFLSDSAVNDLRGANLTDANLSAIAVLSDIDLRGADLSGAVVTRASLKNVNLNGADLSDIVYDAKTTWPKGFSPPSMESTHLDYKDVSYADFRDFNLSNTTFSCSVLVGTDLSAALITDTKLEVSESVIYDRATLWPSDIVPPATAGKDWSRCSADLSRADYSEMNLNSTILSRVEMASTNLSRATLVDAELDSANLRMANLSGADLRRANLHRADVRGADLSGSNLEGADLTGVIFDEATTWPSGFGPR